PVETNDAASVVQHHDQGTGSLKNGGNKIAFLTQAFLRFHQPPLPLQLRQPTPDDGGHELHEVDVLDQVVECAALHHFDGHALVALAGDDDEWNRAARIGQRADEITALNVMELQVEQEQIGGVL